MSAIPKYNIYYKSESLLMKILSKILFFNKNFLTSYTTTLGRNIYFTYPNYIKNHPITTQVTLVHELVHVKDYEKYGFLFFLMYGFPQILAPLSFLLLFIFPWWVSLLAFLFLLAPLPAYFRMKFELKAYTFSLYCLHKLSIKYNYKINFNQYIENYTDNFIKSEYYFMWLFFNKEYFKEALKLIQDGKKPYYEEEYYEMADEVLDKLELKFKY